MLDVGFGEIALIVIVVLIFFGPKSIPEVARTLSKAFSKLKDVQDGFQSQMNDIKNEMNETIRVEEEKKIQKTSKPKEDLKINDLNRPENQNPEINTDNKEMK